MILVTGATGRVGYPLMEALADTGADVTAMVRVEAKAADLPGAPRHVVATFDDPPPAAVLREFDRIFLLSPEIEEQAELETVFIDAIAAAGHRPHVVKICADGFQDPGCEVRFMLSHRQVAMHLERPGPAGHVPRRGHVHGEPPHLGRGDPSHRHYHGARGAGRAGWVAAADVAKAAARVLTSPGHENQTYVLTGPEALGYRTSRPGFPPSSRGRWTTRIWSRSLRGTSCSRTGSAAGRRTATWSGSSGSGRAARRP